MGKKQEKSRISTPSGEQDDTAAEARRETENRGPDADDSGTVPDQQGPEDGTAEAEAPDTREDELARLREALLRAHADMENLRKRTARELEKSRKFILESFVRDLLPVLDSLEQALVSDNGDDTEGLHLTRKQLLKVLTEHGLVVLDPHGERFDPSWHEAMSAQPSEQYESGTVIQVLQKGFRLHDRLLRPARVIVSQEPPGTREEPGSDD